jgi:hypothetical protein
LGGKLSYLVILMLLHYSLKGEFFITSTLGSRR